MLLGLSNFSYVLGKPLLFICFPTIKLHEPKNFMIVTNFTH